MRILILAAGTSARMRGSDKLLEPVDGTTQLRRVVESALATHCPVAVALPPASESRYTALLGLPVQTVIVANPGEGMAASIRAGALAAGGDGALMILPADMPEIDTDDLLAVIAEHHKSPEAIFRGSAQDVAGHPVVIPQALVPLLQRLRGDEGARSLIRAHAGLLRLVPLPGNHATLDLDTPEEWAAWRDHHGVQKSADGPTDAKGAIYRSPEHPSMRDPLFAASERPEQAVLAVITNVTGASYRFPGAMMALFADGSSAGSLTNGCIEGDLAIHAASCLETGQVAHLRYGAGSPFFDIRLPCGGGLEVTLFPRPDAAALSEVVRLRAQRRFIALRFDQTGKLSVQESQPTGWDEKAFVIDVPPDLLFAVFGEGPEAVVFTRLVHSSGYPHRLITHSPDTFAAVRQSGCTADLDVSRHLPSPFRADARTAVVTFFHDHHRETAILKAALESEAFYVGAQGSRRVAKQQLERLAEIGIGGAELGKFHSPIGLIPSARDPRTLAVSVLAEIMKVSKDARHE